MSALLVPIGPILYHAQENKHWQKGCTNKCFLIAKGGPAGCKLELLVTLLKKKQIIIKKSKFVAIFNFGYKYGDKLEDIYIALKLILLRA